MATFTLADYNKDPDPLIAGVASVLRRASPIMERLPFVTKDSLNIQVIRESGRPSISWRKIGNDHGSAKGQVDLVTETAFSFGNYIDTDKVYMKAGNLLYDPRALWSKQTVESMAATFNDAFINGDPTSNPDALTGLWYRINNDHSSMKIQADASGLDISPDGMTSTTISQFLDKLDQLIYSMADHSADMLIMNSTCLLRAQAAFRASGLLSITQDWLGRDVMTYRGAQLIDAGYKYDDSTAIIGNVETDAGALTGGDGTSIYAVRTGTEYLTGWQEYPLDVQDLGLLEDGLTYRTVVDWVVGLAITNPRSVGRLYAVVAA